MNFVVSVTPLAISDGLLHHLLEHFLLRDPLQIGAFVDKKRMSETLGGQSCIGLCFDAVDRPCMRDILRRVMDPCAVNDFVQLLR